MCVHVLSFLTNKKLLARLDPTIVYLPTCCSGSRFLPSRHPAHIWKFSTTNLIEKNLCPFENGRTDALLISHEHRSVLTNHPAPKNAIQNVHLLHSWICWHTLSVSPLRRPGVAIFHRMHSSRNCRDAVWSGLWLSASELPSFSKGVDLSLRK